MTLERLEKMPKHFWRKESNCKDFLEWAIDQHFDSDTISSLQMLSRDHIARMGGDFLLRGKVEVSDLLRKYFPHLEVQAKTQFSQSQAFVFQVVKKHFPEEVIKFDFQHPEIHYLASSKRIQLDIFLPNLNLALEYQVRNINNLNSFLKGCSALQVALPLWLSRQATIEGPRKAISLQTSRHIIGGST
jgi:hypothetical protein